MRLFRILRFILLILLLLCCKKKSTQPDDGLPHYWPRYTDCEPAWSADGKTIAYSHGGLDTTAGIYLIDVDGTNKRLLRGGAGTQSPDFSPDGNWMVFVYSAQIFKIKLNGDSLTQLTFEGRNFFPDWSPHGIKIAYEVTEPADSFGVYLMNMDGTSPHLVPGGYCGCFPDFSPDGKKIVCEIASYIPGNDFVDHYFWIISLEDANHIRLPLFRGDNRYPVFSPDGKKVAFSSAYSSAPVVYVMDSNGKNLKLLTPEGGAEPAWSPDGEYIAYTYVHPDYGRIFIMNADGSNKRQLTFGK